MKKMMITVVIGVALTFAVTANGTTPENKEANTETTVESTGSYFKLINDTGEKVEVYTGSGTTTLNPRGGSTSISCKSSKEVKVDGEAIFKISTDLCDKTVKLSEYL